MSGQAQALRLEKIIIPEDKKNYYFVTFSSGEHAAKIIADRHDIYVELLVEGSTPLAEIEKIGRNRAEKFLKDLVKQL